MGYLTVFTLIFIGGIASLLFSILAWRLREKIYFYLGIIFTGLMLIYLIINFEFIMYLLTSPNDAFLGVITLSFVVIPIYFLIRSKTKEGPGTHQTGVTDAYLDEIINSEDEEIDYE